MRLLPSLPRHRWCCSTPTEIRFPRGQPYGSCSPRPLILMRLSFNCHQVAAEVQVLKARLVRQALKARQAKRERRARKAKLARQALTALKGPPDPPDRRAQRAQRVRQALLALTVPLVRLALKVRRALMAR